MPSAPPEWRVMVNKLIAEVRRLRDERAWPARDLILKLPERDGGVVVAPEAMERYLAAERLADIVDRFEAEIGCENFYGELGPALTAYREAKGE